MKPTHTFTGFDGHLILYCKNQYKYPLGFIEGLRMIWSIRCGFDYNPNDHSIDRYIAGKLYSILTKICPNRISYLQDRIHEEIDYNYRYEGLNGVQTIISIYCSELSNLKIKQKVNIKYRSIIKLPRPMKTVFNRILKGKGKYNDYHLIKPKT